MMGRVLLRMVVSKTKDEEEKDLRIFGDLTDLADRLAKDFVVKVGYRTCANHKYFWRADFLERVLLGGRDLSMMMTHSVFILK